MEQPACEQFRTITYYQSLSSSAPKLPTEPRSPDDRHGELRALVQAIRTVKTQHEAADLDQGSALIQAFSGTIWLYGLRTIRICLLRQQNRCETSSWT